MQLVRSQGTCSALSVLVIFYNVLADGYHTPLSKAQIAELFYAGRLGRNQPCKQVEMKEWRTIDELFPLLKYHSSAPPISNEGKVCPRSPGPWFLMLLGTGGIAALALLEYFFTSGAGVGLKGVGSPAANRARSLKSASTSYVPSQSSLTVNAAPSRLSRPTNPNETSSPSFDSQRARVAQDRLHAEQRQREQTLAQDRANDERRKLEQEKAAGRTERIPLDRHTIVHNVGGLNVTVMIHDHDITTVDVWTNFHGPVRMTKQKGITGSRTDETLIYQNGNASLYYVWEISGKLNHCLLRVRED
ncbi:MAG TPA: hypothetical protein VNP98_12845 [Chthoniobacterales bacterium]|nr:hypothetical protein [Chthoniobacterales bacterium]